jgi:acetylornithine deacetylase/succinyl-diaminopimelate desuccinylase-like protein
VTVEHLRASIDRCWAESIVPTLVDYIRIPCKSPEFDANWAANGFIDAAVALFEFWARAKLAAIPGAAVETVRLPGRTPLLLLEIPASGSVNDDDCVLLYGHLDKQPEMSGWSEGLGPWSPVLRDEKLYGRGGADDGYAMFGALSAILALHEQGLAHARCVILIEACEESGSYDLPYYVAHLGDRIGTPALVVCLDSGCGNYGQLWLTTSLRGLLTGTLTVRVLQEGVHSGGASGIVPSSFRILRQVLARLEDAATGHLSLRTLHADIPRVRRAEARDCARALGPLVHTHFPFVEGMCPGDCDGTELLLKRTWRPQLEIVGADGLPTLGNAGNVLRPFTSVRLSFRLPPTVDAAAAGEAVRSLLETNPPYGSQVTFDAIDTASGWNAPDLAPWLADAIRHASAGAFSAPPVLMGEGGTIPFIAMLGLRFPQAQFVITGVLGPHSNAHGPNEFLHLPTARRVSLAIAMLLAAHRTAA